MLIYVYDDDDDEARKPYPANNVEPGHARLHLNQINRVKCQVAAAGIASEDRYDLLRVTSQGPAQNLVRRFASCKRAYTAKIVRPRPTQTGEAAAEIQ